MQKDFDGWNRRKKYLEEYGCETLPFHEREIWWCSLGQNLGQEQSGKNWFFERPVLVFKKFNEKLAWVLPMTSHLKEGKYYHTLSYDNKRSVLILSQLRLVSVKRFLRYVRKISLDEYARVQDKIIGLVLN